MLTGTTDHMTMNEYQDAILSAEPGQAIIYATGDLAFDSYNAARRNEHELGGLIASAWRSHENGVVCLTQRRLEQNKYEYRATTKRLAVAAVRRVAA